MWDGISRDLLKNFHKFKGQPKASREPIIGKVRMKKKDGEKDVTHGNGKPQ